MPKDTFAAIMENEGLIYKAANYFNGYSKEDLYQAGCIGIIKGIKNYDENRNTKFSSYIYSYILGEMKKLVREDKPLKVSRDINKLKNKILEANDKLAQKLMRKPTEQELCEFLDIDSYVLAEALNSNVKTCSIDSLIGDTNMMFEEVISSEQISYDDLLFLKTEIESLEEPERTIMIKRYYEDMTQEEVANYIGKSQVDVSRALKKAKTKIKTHN